MKVHKLKVVFWKEAWRDRAERQRAPQWMADTPGLIGAYSYGVGKTKMHALMCLLQLHPQLLGSIQDWADLEVHTVKNREEADAMLEPYRYCTNDTECQIIDKIKAGIRTPAAMERSFEGDQRRYECRVGIQRFIQAGVVELDNHLQLRLPGDADADA